jgi:superfamily II DNA/RNA helicase
LTSNAPSTRRRRRPEHSAAAERTPRPARAAVIDDDTPAAPVRTDATWAEFDLPERVIACLEHQGLTEPFPIQVATLPDTMAGKDVLGRGRTGSGKTLAFSLPLVARLMGGRRVNRQARALILVPTRELANQVHAVIDPLARSVGLRATTIFGGVGQNPQVKAMQNGVDILIACPGRLEDLIKQRHVDLSGVEITVLDEADHMADLGFLPGVKRLLDQTPKKGQRLLFSATLDNGVGVLVDRYMHNPVTHSVSPAVSPVETMTHHVFNITTADKPKIVHELAGGMQRTLLFMRTKHTAKKLAKQLTQAGIPAVELHGNLSQQARERNLAAFSEGRCKVLVATDIAARGIHVDEVAIVVHVDPPTEHKAYLHRSGRTARAGTSGHVVTLVTPEQVRDVRTLAKQAGISPTTSSVSPGASQITALVGEAAPYVTPAPPVEQPSRPAGSGRPNSRGRSGAAPKARSARGSSNGNGPARTRKELESRAGQQPAARRRSR